jgi:hypothetical protein
MDHSRRIQIGAKSDRTDSCITVEADDLLALIFVRMAESEISSISSDEQDQKVTVECRPRLGVSDPSCSWTMTLLSDASDAPLTLESSSPGNLAQQALENEEEPICDCNVAGLYNDLDAQALRKIRTARPAPAQEAGA